QPARERHAAAPAPGGAGAVHGGGDVAPIILARRRMSTTFGTDCTSPALPAAGGRRMRHGCAFAAPLARRARRRALATALSRLRTLQSTHPSPFTLHPSLFTLHSSHFPLRSLY